MAKIYEEKSRTYQSLVRTDCDVCKQEIKDDRAADPDFNDEEVSLSHVMRRTSYGDVLDSRRLEIDICGSCFVAHILPLLAFLGVNTTYDET